MSQQALDFGRDHRVAEAQRKVLRVLNDAVDSIGLMVAAGACGCRTQDLSDALGGRSNRYVRIDWVLAILDLVHGDQRHRLGAALVEWTGMTVHASRPKTPEEKLAEIERKVAARFGAAGAELIAEVSR